VVPTERGLDEQHHADEIIAEIERRFAATLGEEAYAQLRHALMTITDPAASGALPRPVDAD
jgi:hypothetical protein